MIPLVVTSWYVSSYLVVILYNSWVIVSPSSFSTLIFYISAIHLIVWIVHTCCWIPTILLIVLVVSTLCCLSTTVLIVWVVCFIRIFLNLNLIYAWNVLMFLDFYNIRFFHVLCDVNAFTNPGWFLFCANMVQPCLILAFFFLLALANKANNTGRSV